MRRHVLVLAVVGAAGLALLLSSAAATRPGVKLIATPPPVTSETAATFKWIARTGTRRTRCGLRWHALPGTRDKASSLAQRRAKLRRCSSPKTWTKLGRGRYTFVLIAAGRRTSTSTHYRWRVVRGSARGRQFSGTFDCYGTTGCKSLPAAARCTRTISSGLQSALTSASGGAVICLNPGSYGNVTLSSKAHSKDVIVQPAANAAVAVGKVTLSAVTHLRFTGNGGGSATMSIAGNNVDKGTSNCSAHITFDHATFTAPVNVRINSNSGCSVNEHLLWDHDKFDHLTSGDFEGRISILGHGAGSGRAGIVFSNSSFIGEPSAAACSDGFFLADTNGVQIGPGNEFSDLPVNGCGGVHVDPIGGFTSHNTVVVGNYFHDMGGGGTGILSDLEPGQIVKNNVILSTGYWHSILVKGARNNTYTHNVLAGDVDWQISNEGTSGSGNLVRNNVFTKAAFGSQCINLDGSSTTYTADHNLGIPRLDRGCDVKGPPVFVARPSSGYYHYQLSPKSPGYHGATDGKSIGIAP